MRSDAIGILLAAATLAGATAGCDAGAAGPGDLVEGSLSGRKATVEYRPALRGGTIEPILKQRAGTLKKVSASWVALTEDGTNLEVWIPRDMVLEIRFDR